MTSNPNPVRLLIARPLAWFLSLAALTTALPAQQAGPSPVKIYVMIGQSNMEGHGEISPVATQGTLEYIVANEPGTYGFVGTGVGNWVVRDDVWIHYQRLSGGLRTGGLVPGYGAAGGNTTIGPELGFGHSIGDSEGNQVLLVKTAWGGRSLGNDFLPPSSGPYPKPREYGDPGYYYQETLRLVKEATANLGTYFPNYNGQGYQIAGICFHQGWNDRSKTSYSDAYETNLKNFIRDIRSKEYGLGVPGLPFVIATSGMGGGATYTPVELAQRAMLNPYLTNPSPTDLYTDFVGNVAVIDTRVTYTPLALDFWQPAANSPQDQIFHWNRNARTYLNIGLAMGREMPLLTPPVSPSRLLATGGPTGVTLTWQNGTETPTSVQVLRDGVEIAAAAPPSPTTYLDSAALPGVHNYELVFTMPVNPAAPLTVTHDSGITGLTAYRSQNGVTLNWTNNLGYAGIEVRRNGNIIEPALAGGTTSYEDATAPATGVLTYHVVPTTGTSASAEVVINLGPHSSTGALIYEPFDFPAAASLNGQTPSGFGLSGPWTRHSGTSINELQVVAPGMTFGTLPAAGNRVRNNNTGGERRANHVLIGNTLSQAGLLADGATLWFSILVEPVTGANASSGFGLADGNANYFDSAVNAVGFNVQNGSDLQYWSNLNGTSSRPAAKNDLSLNLPHLVVGKLVWGTGGGNDTFEIFLPGTDLSQGSRYGALQSINMNQSAFDRIVLYNQGGGIEFDEIRFGATYDDVIAAGIDTSGDITPPTPAQMSWAPAPAAISDSAIIMTAVTASDANGVEYQFTETSGNPGGSSSGWQSSPTYTDTGLDANTQYSYKVQARDKSVNHNTNTTSSPDAPATTFAADTNPPPTPGFATAPTAASSTEITMTATTVTDPEGSAVQYRFNNTTLGTNSGWQGSAAFTDSGLTPETPYQYTVQARDTALNESSPSAAESATTLAGGGPGGALIYEPFDYSPGKLQQVSSWSKVTGDANEDFVVQATGLSYGTLPISGAQIRSDITTGGDRGYTLNSAAATIGGAGLLADGQTLWMSAVIQAVTSSNASIVVRLGTDYVNSAYAITGGTGDSVGLNVQNGNDLQTRYHVGGTAGGNTNITANLPSASTTLLVVEMIWNADNTQADTIKYYLPNTDLNLGLPVLTINAAIFNQAAFDTFSVSGSNASVLLDEIRFGASYDAVIGQGGGGNTPPTISDIADQSIPSGGNTGTLAVTVGDAETAPGSLTATGSSSNTTLVPNENIVFGGSAANRTITLTPVSGLVGSAIITVTVNDGTTTANDTFLLTVTDNYLSWATANNVTGGANGDSNNNGVPNLVEYALVDGGGRGVLSGNTNTITFTKRGAPYSSDVSYIIQTSETLANDWITAVAGVVENASTISYTFTPGSPVKRFARLKVVAP